MQTKDIDKVPVLQFLKRNKGQWCFLGGDHERCVSHAMPLEVPFKLRLAVMRNLIERGLVKGCPCGCRGDFEITKKGETFLELHINLSGVSLDTAQVE